MFDIGFSELIVIGIVALVVIGPERLPKVARTAGLLLGRMQRYVNDVKSDINREMQLDELKKLKTEMQESARSFEQDIRSELQSVEETVGQTLQSAQSSLDGLADPATDLKSAESEKAAVASADGPAVIATAKVGEADVASKDGLTTHG
jgi:sec-independent protein translocase protein TatB